jgi:hypothetical protein
MFAPATETPQQGRAMADMPTDVSGPYFIEEAPEMKLVDRGWELRFVTNDKQCIVIHMPERAVKQLGVKIEYRFSPPIE